MTNNITWVGLDARKKAINGAVLLARAPKPQEWIPKGSRFCASGRGMLRNARTDTPRPGGIDDRRT